MKWKIFKYTLFSLLVGSLFFAVATVGYLRGLYEEALFFFLILPALLFVAVCVSLAIAESVVRPIRGIDPARPEALLVYDELRPIIGKLAAQNYRLARQMNELKIREGEFASITSNMSEGMLVINSHTNILSCNEGARRIFGVTGELPKSVLSLDASDGFRDAVGAALAGGNGYYEIARGEKHYSVIATSVAGDGIIEGAVIVIVDDTEKEHREALRREFTSNISHELKTPLTSISGFAELIRCGMAEGDEAKHFADNKHNEDQRLITLVGDIIRLTQLDGREAPYDEEPIDLYGVAEETAERLTSVAERAGVSVSLSGSRVYVNGNRQILEEMVYNLTDNAIKYNKEGGEVNIEVGEQGDCVFVAVKDNGIGIPRDKQDRVFERFYRVDKSHSKSIGGTGLGLSIVKHAAAYHKARIALESEEGVGTKITVRFCRWV